MGSPRTPERDGKSAAISNNAVQAHMPGRRKNTGINTTIIRLFSHSDVQARRGESAMV